MIAVSIVKSYVRHFLARREEWKLVSDLFAPDVRPVRAPDHARWLAKHEERHPHREFLLVLEGGGTASLNGRIYPTSPGTLFAFDRDDTHDRRYPPTTRSAMHLWFGAMQQEFWIQVLSVRNGRISPQKRYHAFFESRELTSVVNAPFDVVRACDEPDALKRNAFADRVGCLLFDILDTDLDKHRPANLEARQARLMKQVQDYIAEHLDGSLNVDGLARIAGYSKYHFVRLFHARTGETPLECINRARHKKVKELRKRHYLDKQIARELGFSSPVSFSYWLRKQGLQK